MIAWWLLVTASIVFAVIMAISVVMPVAMVIVVISMISPTPFMFRHIDALIPVVLHKIDVLAAGVIFPAMPAPVPAMV